MIGHPPVHRKKFIIQVQKARRPQNEGTIGRGQDDRITLKYFDAQ